MEDYRGEFQRLYGHQDIIVSAGAAYRAGAEWILSEIENQIRFGVVFHADETIQIGWMTLKIAAKVDGGLEILQPEFGSMPVRWVRGANNAIRDITIQKEVSDQIGTPADYPSMRQSAVISPDFLGEHREFELSRDVPEGNDSGWVFREGRYGGADGTLSSLYQIAITVPAIIPFLALPPDSVVRRSGVGIEIFSGGSTISSANNDFLARLLNSVYLRG